MEKHQMVLVPEQWLKSLLQTAEDLNAKSEEYEYGKSAINDVIHFKAICLLGYAESAKYILKDNERVER